MQKEEGSLNFNDLANQYISSSQFNSQPNYNLQNKQKIPFQFLHSEMTEFISQKKSIDISSLSKTKYIQPEPNAQATYNSYKTKEPIKQINDNKTNIFRIRDNSDPTGYKIQNDNKSLPKLKQNGDNFSNINKQILERSYMNSKIYKGQMNSIQNTSFNKIESKNDSPLKNMLCQRSTNPLRNSQIVYQRVTSNIGTQPKSNNNLDQNDSTCKSQFDKPQQLIDDAYISKLYHFEMEQREQQQQQMESMNYLKRNIIKRPQFKLNPNLQQVISSDKNQRLKKIQNNHSNMATLLNIQPIQTNKTQDEDSISTFSEMLGNKEQYSFDKDEIVGIARKIYNNSQFQAQQIQPNKNVDYDSNQSTKSKISMRLSSASKNQGGNQSLPDNQQSYECRKSQNIKNDYSPENNNSSQVPFAFHLNYLERSLLTEREQAILKRTQLSTDQQSPIKTKRQIRENQLPSTKNGKIILQLNRSQSRKKDLSNQNNNEIQKQDISESQIQQSETIQLNSKNEIKQNIEINNNIIQNRNNIKLNSLNNIDDYQEYDGYEDLASHYISTDVAINNFDKDQFNNNNDNLLLFQDQNLPIINIKQNKISSNSNVIDIFEEEQSTQSGSKDDQSINQKQLIQNTSFSVTENKPLNNDNNNNLSQQQSQIQNYQKSLTQCSPRQKQNLKINQQVQDITNLMKATLANNQITINQRQFLRTKRSIPNHGEKNHSTTTNTTNQQKKDHSTQKNQIKSLVNLDNDKESKSPSKKGNKQKIIKTVPEVSSKCWSVFNLENNELLYGKNHNFQVEIASLTKIMTCYVTISFLEQNKIDIKNVYIEVSKVATKTIGTTANLEKGDYVSAYELLYGLMLPSGNDAAVVLSEGIGYLLLRIQQKQSISSPETNLIFIDYKCKTEVGGLNACSAIFIKEMNQYAWKLGLEKTNYACVHGLSNRYNISTARDVGLLSSIVMKHPLVQQVVNTKEYETKDVLDSNKSNQDQYEWENTNQMLEKKGYDGLKTGVTDTAGPCLSSSYKCKRNGNQLRLICVLLNCKSMDHRWPETKQLISWSLKNFYPKESKNNNNNGDVNTSVSFSPPKQKK